eukprot:m.462398 g.462398  ORF g.462398 m.462398 type:complete len:376 (-) comp22642_c0_seq1:25-1152(-)
MPPVGAEAEQWAESDGSGPSHEPVETSRKAKRTKEDGRPRRPASGYQLYMSHARQTAQKAHPGLGFGAVTKVLGAQWTGLSDESKKPFLDEAKILREEYEETLAAWEKEQQLAHEEPTPPPRRSASQNAADFIAAATSGDGAPAPSAAKSMSNGKAPAKRRRMGHYAGLGNIDEDTNTDTVCKACSMMFTTLEDKRAHLLSQHHRDTVGETEAAQPARDTALTIPIFTDEFVEHYERREKALRELRLESDQLVRNNSVMVEQIEKLKTSVSEVRLATAKLDEDNAELLKDAEDLKNAISDAFRGIPLLPGFPAGPPADEASIDTYLHSLAAVLASDLAVEDFRQRAVTAAATVERNWNDTVRDSAAAPQTDAMLT